jgi:hypothetical protein
MHNDDFNAFDCTFATYDDHFASAGGHHYDLHNDDYTVDPFLASFDLGTADIEAIAIRNAREACEQLQAQAFAAMQEREQVAAVGWVQAVVRGAEPAYFAKRAAVIVGPERWTLAQQLSMALAAELGYALDDRDQDCWFRPVEREWQHMPTDRQHAYNAAYERFCKLVGRRLPADDPLSADELHDADVHELMLAAQRELEEPSSALARVMRRLRAWRTQLH